MVFNREFYLQQLIDKENHGLIKIVSGIRRCGKSYLLDPLFKNYLIKKDHIIKIDLDERINKKYLDSDKQEQEFRPLMNVNDFLKKLL